MFVSLRTQWHDEADLNAQRIAAIRSFASRLNVLEPDVVDSEDVLPSSNRQKLSIGDAQIISEEHKHVKKVENSGSCASMLVSRRFVVNCGVALVAFSRASVVED